jgi:hypothetical protein
MFCFSLAFCFAQTKEKSKILYCGFSIPSKDLSTYDSLCTSQLYVEAKDTLWNLVRQVSDSLKTHIPKELPFQVKLAYLDQEMAGVDVFVASDESHYEAIACVVLDAEFIGKVPDQWYLRVFANDKPDKTLLFAVKRRRK